VCTSSHPHILVHITPAQYVTLWSRVYVTVGRLASYLSHHSTAAVHTDGLLLSTLWAGQIDRQRQAPVPSSNGATEWHSAANVGSVMLTAELMRLNIDLLIR